MTTSIEDVDERPDRGTEQPADLTERPHRTGVAGSCPLDENRGIGAGTEESRCRPVRREP